MKKQLGCIVPISVILFIALVVSVLSFNKAEAQSTRNPCFYAVSPSATDGCTSVSTSKPLPVTASVSVSGFAPATTGTPISVTTGGVSGTLPAGTVVVATNVGTTNAAYCKLGASSTVSDQYISPNGGWFAFTVGAATQLTCITSTSTTTVNMTGGSGIATGTGGGSGGSGGGGDATAANQTAVQAPVAAAAASATKSNLVGGQYLSSLPTMTNAQQAAVTFDVNGRLVVLEKNSADILTAVQAAVPAGTNLIGDVNLRQGGNALSTTNGIYSNLLQGNAVISTTNGLYNNLLQGNAVLSATNGLFANILQGNAALSATNGSFSNQLQGNAVLSATNPSFAAPIPTTAGGLVVYNVQPAASDNHIVIKAGAGQVYKIDAFNNSATVNYVRLYNATTGFNGCNSATNLVWQGIIPASTSGAGLSSSWDLGIAFATGISICVTSGYAQTDTTNATASALIVNVGYK